jgi:chaperonin GroES
MSIRPLHNYIVVEPDEAKEVSKGGILIPEQSLDKPQRGTVLDVGPDVDSVTCGDYILYAKGVGMEFEENSLNFLLMKEEDLLGILDN